VEVIRVGKGARIKDGEGGRLKGGEMVEGGKRGGLWVRKGVG
jgi:hypothetical protein